MRKILILSVVVVAGCASGGFTNRLYCSADHGSAAFTSWYLGFGVGAQIDTKDAAAVCAAAPASAAPASAAK